METEIKLKSSRKEKFGVVHQAINDCGTLICLLFLVCCFLPVLYHSNVACALFGSTSIALYLGGCFLQKSKPNNKLVKEAVVLGKNGMAMNAIVGYLIFFLFLVNLRSFTPSHALQYMAIVVIKVLVVYIPLSMIARKILRNYIE